MARELAWMDDIGAGSRATADRLIAATRSNSAEFGPELANHLPMTLEILCRLGASAQRLEAFAEQYDRVNAVPALRPSFLDVTRATWRDAFGDRTREADYRRFFAAEAARLGGAGAIRAYVPTLAPGAGASALHGLMRLAYGVLRGDDSEIGAALGYWAATFLTLRDEPNGPPDTDDPLAPAVAMRGEANFGCVDVATDLLWHWMRAVGGMPEFAPLIGRLRIGPGSLDRMARASLALYAGTMSFEALHALTGAFWVRQVAPLLDDPGVLIRAYWQAILAVYPKIGMPDPADEGALNAMRALRVPPDPEIAAAAVASDDEHDHSLVFTGLREFDRTRDGLYRVLAAKRVGLLT